MPATDSAVCRCVRCGTAISRSHVSARPAIFSADASIKRPDLPDLAVRPLEPLNETVDNQAAGREVDADLPLEQPHGLAGIGAQSGAHTGYELGDGVVDRLLLGLAGADRRVARQGEHPRASGAAAGEGGEIVDPGLVEEAAGPVDLALRAGGIDSQDLGATADPSPSEGTADSCCCSRQATRITVPPSSGAKPNRPKDIGNRKFLAQDVHISRTRGCSIFPLSQ